MLVVDRTDQSLVARWWWTVDRWALAAILLLIVVGCVLALAATPAVAERMGLDRFYFARRQFGFLSLAVVIMMLTSLLAPRGVLRVAVAGFLVALAATALTPFIGFEVKGATRWLSLGGLSVQPSEFVKPCFIVVTAWLLAKRRDEETFPGRAIAAGLLAMVGLTLLTQPDVGMTMVVALVWGAQLFLAGLPMAWVVFLGIGIGGAAVTFYYAFPHVRSRFDRFFDSSVGDNFQVSQSLEAFRSGGFFGRGPGEGQVKAHLPDAHADFVFAVAGEEFGIVVCLALVALFAFVMLRGFARLLRGDDLFGLLAGCGLLAQFGIQTFVNIASSIRLIPPKGMTLPFISYGGSSALALALGMGMFLALTRERPGEGHVR
ncbi:MAG: cell division protein FtsW [Rhodospirillales bacterium]|nr:cell division protein FtsW [Rhodospirillales bacterium]